MPRTPNATSQSEACGTCSTCLVAETFAQFAQALAMAMARHWKARVPVAEATEDVADLAVYAAWELHRTHRMPPGGIRQTAAELLLAAEPLAVIMTQPAN